MSLFGIKYSSYNGIKTNSSLHHGLVLDLDADIFSDLPDKTEIDCWKDKTSYKHDAIQSIARHYPMITKWKNETYVSFDPSSYQHLRIDSLANLPDNSAPHTIAAMICCEKNANKNILGFSSSTFPSTMEQNSISQDNKAQMYIRSKDGIVVQPIVDNVIEDEQLVIYVHNRNYSCIFSNNEIRTFDLSLGYSGGYNGFDKAAIGAVVTSGPINSFNGKIRWIKVWNKALSSVDLRVLATKYK